MKTIIIFHLCLEWMEPIANAAYSFWLCVLLYHSSVLASCSSSIAHFFIRICRSVPFVKNSKLFIHAKNCFVFLEGHRDFWAEWKVFVMIIYCVHFKWNMTQFQRWNSQKLLTLDLYLHILFWRQFCNMMIVKLFRSINGSLFTATLVNVPRYSVTHSFSWVQQCAIMHRVHLCVHKMIFSTLTALMECINR